MDTLSSGSFSEVYPLSSNRVVKVCHKAATDAWPFFGLYCLKENDIFLPKIYNMWINFEEHIYTAEMELLYPFIFDEDKTFDDCELSVREDVGDKNVDRIYDLCNRVKDFANDYTCYEVVLDALFPHNIMKNSNGDLKVTDPLCYRISDKCSTVYEEVISGIVEDFKFKNVLLEGCNG